MKLKSPINKNYCATVVTIKNIIPLNNCDNVCHTSIFGNLVIVSKSIKIGDKGLFFPVETQLSDDFLRHNNLYRHSEKNIDKDKKGYFSDNGRIRAVKFRGNISSGFFIPMSSLFFISNDLELNLGDEFDELNNIRICRKYVVVRKNSNNKTKSGKRFKVIDRLINNQFRFHIDTSQLGKNIHKVKPDDIISITRKLHGTSGISSKILVKRRLSIVEKILKFFGIKIVETEYDNIYSSRRMIKNKYYNPKKIDYYNEDIWKLANNVLKDFLINSQTIYYEIVGFLPYTGSFIQKGFDYGCDNNKFSIYIYRITYTNDKGTVIEMPMKYVKNWCKENNLNVVPELYYGYASHYLKKRKNESVETWRNRLLDKLKEDYLENDCEYCKNNVPNEGIVLRIEKNNIESYKLKSYRFLQYETKLLDSGQVDIEEQ